MTTEREEEIKYLYKIVYIVKKLRLYKYNGIIQKEWQLDVIHWNSIGYSTIIEEKMMKL